MNQKEREKSHTVKFLIKVFQTVHGYFLGTCVVHCAGGWSVKMMTSKNADDSKQKQKKASALLFEIQRICVHPRVPAWTPLHVLSSLLMCHQCFILLEPECTGANGFAIFCYWPRSTVKSKKNYTHFVFPIQHKWLWSASLCNRPQHAQLGTSEMAQPWSSVSVLFRRQLMSPSAKTYAVCKVCWFDIRISYCWGWNHNGVNLHGLEFQEAAPHPHS